MGFALSFLVSLLILLTPEPGGVKRLQFVRDGWWFAWPPRSVQRLFWGGGLLLLLFFFN